MGGDHARHDYHGEVPFWLHQLVELLLAALLLVEGARTGQHTAVLVGLGAALLLLSLASDGALGAWPRIGRRAHRILDFVAAAILAVAPVVLSVDAALPIVVLEAAAAGLLWLAIRTNWAPRPVPRRSSRPGAALRSPTPAAPAPTPADPPFARRLGAVVGRARADGPRRLGRAVGRARARSRRPPTIT